MVDQPHSQPPCGSTANKSDNGRSPSSATRETVPEGSERSEREEKCGGESGQTENHADGPFKKLGNAFRLAFVFLDTHDGAVIAVATVLILLVNGAYTYYARKQWYVMSGQLAEMRAEQRPWVYANIGVGGKIFRNISGGYTIPVAFILHNTGRAPAQLVSLVFAANTMPYLHRAGKLMVLSDERRVCAKGEKNFHATNKTGATVFPGEKLPSGINPGIPSSKWSPFVRDGFGPAILIYGCIIYQRPGNVPLGVTGFAITVDRAKPDHPGAVFALPADPTSVPVTQLRMDGWPQAAAWEAH